MKRSLFFVLSFMVVASAYCVAPQAAQDVKKEIAAECKCDDKCTVACKCPQCPAVAKNKEAAKAKEAAATQAVVKKQAETATAKS